MGGIPRKDIMKVQIIKTGEIKDFEYRVAQRLVLQGKAKWYSEPKNEPKNEPKTESKKKAKKSKEQIEDTLTDRQEYSTEPYKSWRDN